MLPLATLLITLSAPAAPPAPKPQVMEARKLPGVPGPLTPCYPDPAQGLGPRDLDWAIRERARHGVNIPAVALPDASCQVSDRMDSVAGWKAYRVDVPPRAGFKARLHGTHEGWFVVKVLDSWGRLGPGMLQNRIPTGNPEASYRNPKARPSTVFIVVDTSVLDAQGEPYTLDVTRD